MQANDGASEASSADQSQAMSHALTGITDKDNEEVGHCCRALGLIRGTLSGVDGPDLETPACQVAQLTQQHQQGR